MDIINRAIQSPWGWMYAAGRSHIDKAVESHYRMVEMAGMDPSSPRDQQLGHDLWFALISLSQDQRNEAIQALAATVDAASRQAPVPARVEKLVDSAAKGDAEVASAIGNVLLAGYEYAQRGVATVGRFGFRHRREPEPGSRPADRPVLDTRGNDIRIGDHLRDLGRNLDMQVLDVVQEGNLSPIVLLRYPGGRETQRTTKANAHYELIDDLVIRLPRTSQTAGRRRRTAGARRPLYTRSRQY